VDLSVEHQGAAVLEQLAAHLAGVLLSQVVAVGSLDVKVEAVARGVRLGADGAGEGPLAGVHAQMDAHRRLRLKRLAALRALEDGATVGGVLQTLVPQQRALVTEASAALVALEAALLVEVRAHVFGHQKGVAQPHSAPVAVQARHRPVVAPLDRRVPRVRSLSSPPEKTHSSDRPILSGVLTNIYRGSEQWGRE